MPEQTHIAQTQLDQFLEAFRKLDLLMIDLLLDENLRYQEMPKASFLKKLGLAFAIFRDCGNSQLLAFPSRCTGTCGSGDDMLNFFFVGDSSPHYMTLIIQVKEGRVADLFECNGMAANAIVPQCNIRVYIDDRFKDFPF
ncbi:hypothetical protein MD537_06975 [Flavihumibacter sediminis]|nr:hypothetical protein [Flavihumibacter sediminis]